MKRNTLPQRGRGLFGNLHTPQRLPKAIQRYYMLAMVLMTSVLMPGMVNAQCSPGWGPVGDLAYLNVATDRKCPMVMDRFHNTPYIAVYRSDMAGLVVRKYNGTEWADLGEQISSSYVDNVCMSWYDGKPYVAYTIEGALYVVRYNTTAWEYVACEEGAPIASDLNDNNGENVVTSMDIDGAGQIYIAYAKGEGFQVAKFNTGSWVTAGTWQECQHYCNPVIELNAGVPYVAFIEANREISVKKYQGGTWSYVGDTAFTSDAYMHPAWGSKSDISLKFTSDGTPYIAVTDNTADVWLPITFGFIYKFDGTDWVNYANVPYLYNTSLAVDDNDTLYMVAGLFNWGTEGTRVFKLNGTTLEEFGDAYMPGISYTGGFSIEMDSDNRPWISRNGPGGLKVFRYNTSTSPYHFNVTANDGGHVYAPEDICNGSTFVIDIFPDIGFDLSQLYVDDHPVEYSIGGYSPYPPYLHYYYVIDEVYADHSVFVQFVPTCTTPTIVEEPWVHPVSCYGGSDGRVIPNVSGEDLVWHWSNGATTPSLDAAYAGMYHYTATNDCGSVTGYVNIPQPMAPMHVHNEILQNVTCYGNANAVVNVTAEYGTPPYSGAGILNDIPAGPREFIVTDANGCTAGTTAWVYQPDQLTMSATMASDLHCYGGHDATVLVNGYGGTPPFIGTGIIEGLAAGINSFTVTDANGCTTSRTMTIYGPAMPMMAYGYPDHSVSCYGGSDGTAFVYGMYGTGPYSGEGHIEGLSAGTHYVTLTDIYGCTATATILMNQPYEPLTAGAYTTHDVDCFGGSNGTVLVEGYGGTSPYSGNGYIGELPAGPHNFTVTDGNGCTATASATVSQPATPVTAISAASPVRCYGGNTGGVMVNAAGGTAPYSGTGFFGGLTAGMYPFTVSDAHGCSSTTNATVSQPIAPLTPFATASDARCFGENSGSANVNATGGTSPYFGTGFFTGLAAGPRMFTITDANGCMANAFATVNQPMQLLSYSTPSDALCYGGSTGSVMVNASGGTFPYSGTGMFGGLTSGFYNYTVTDANGCTSTSYATVGQPSAPLVAMKSISDVLCYGGNTGSVTMTASGGTAPYGGTGTFGGLIAGPYTYTVTDAHGCTASAYPTVGQPSAPLSASNTVTNVFCYGGSTGRVTVTATGGTAPYTGTGLFTGYSAGTYSFAVTDAHGCSTITWATVTQPEGGLVASKSVTNVDCFGNNTGSVLVTATGGTTPYTGTGNMTGLTAGTYNFTVTDGQGCSSYVSATVSQPSSLVASQAVTNVSCYGMDNGQVIVGATGGTSPYVGTGTNTGLSPEPYSYTVTDAHGCTSTVSGTITQPALLVASNTPVISASGFNLLCNKGNTGIVNVSATGGTAPYYNTGAHGGLTATGYEFYVTDSHGCIDSTSGTLDQPAPFYVSASTSDDTICNGASVTLSATGGAGSFLWAVNNGLPITYSSAPVTATPSTGIPTVTVDYTVVGFNTFGCSSEPDTVDVTVLPIGYFTGASAVCTDYSVDLDNGTPGGVWYTPDTAYFSLDQNGIVGGQHYIIGGTYPSSGTISYTMPNGCYRVRTMSVNRTPDPIVGIATVCPNSGLSLPAGIPSGGTWSSSNSNMTITMSTNGIATVNGGSTLGTATISYIMPAGCYVYKTFTIAPLDPITGPTEVCTGNTITLSHPLPGAQWSSNSPAMATINVSTGVVNGLSASTVVMSYKVNPTCYRTYTVNVNTTPAAVTGPVSVCKTANITLLDATAGGTWISDNTSAATVNSTTGIVNGADVGVANISYVMPNGCYKMTTVTVNDNPASITGSTNVCVSRNATYTTTSTGGTWSSSSSVLTISAGPGVASGVAAGSANVIYTLPTGCYAVKPVNVSALPAPITGTFTACQGSTTTVNCITPSLTWSSSDENVATVGSTGTTSALVSGLLPGTTTIGYASAAGCIQTVNVTIYAAPATIGGTTNVCVGATATYTNSVTSGTWSSSATSYATVGSSTGIVTGIAAGTCNLIYTAPGGCKTTKMLTIDAQPTTFTGTLSTCVVANTLLGSTPAGGTWSTTSPNASVNASTGLVTGVAMGSAIISYTNTAGCSRAGTVTIAAGLPAITGPSFICVGGSTTLTNTTGSGTWVSSNTAAGTIASGTGLIGGIAVGNTTITYRTSPTCHTTKDIAVMSAPAAISAPSTSVCIGTPMPLTHAITTGTWSSSTPANATVGSTNGYVTGLATGTTVIAYTTSPGCVVTQLMSVNAQPAVLTGTLNVCQGNTTTVNCVTSGCTWSSSNPDIASVVTSTATSGIITGGTMAGAAVISYTNSLGCSRLAAVTVNPALPAITGYDVVCVSNTTQLAIGATGGTWSSSVPAKGSISTVGVVAGVATGSTTITYKTSNTCFTTRSMSVNGAVAAISGATSVCKDNSASLVCTTPGGAWSTSSANASVIDTSGLVTGLTTGSAVISYQLTGMSCYKTYTVNVLASPAPITGTTTIAIGTTTTLNNTVTGGTWSSSASTVASIGSTTGAMAGVAVGSATITYKLTSNGCYKTTSVAVVTSMARPVNGTDMEDATVTTVRIFPNPSQGNISVEAPANGTFMVFSMDGKQVARFDVTAPATSVSLPHDLAAGMYMCRFDGADGSSAIVRLVYKP